MSLASECGGQARDEHLKQTPCPRDRRRFAALLLTAASGLLAGCGPTPLSALHTDSAHAAHIANVWYFMAWGSAIILLIMVAFAFIAVRAKPNEHRRRSFWLLLGGGVVFPVTVIAALLIYTYSAAPTQSEAQYRIKVTAQQWHWAVSYPDAQGGERHSINVIHVPEGMPVLIELHATDVIHSFWVPRLGGKMDAIPGRINRVIYTAEQAGTYAGQCVEYCGVGHAAMRFQLIAHPFEQYEEIIASLPLEQGAP